MQKFQDLLTQAAQLKQQQLKQQRKNFQALPEYLKSGLNYAKKYVQLRKQNYLVQKYISQKLKKQGNDQYILQNYGEALNKYQEALSVFRYIHAKKYENLKDEDIIYENYKPEQKFKEQHNIHLIALYLNICSALTKMNKKDEAIHSAEEAYKINDSNPKIYYKKAQAYLQYINRDSSDVKLGFYYLNKAYELSKDQSILVQMHKIKKELDEERQKQKNWFKFMFQKSKSNQISKQKQIPLKENKQKNGKLSNHPIQEIRSQHNVNKSISQQENQKVDQRSSSMQQSGKNIKLKQQLDRFRQENQERQNKIISESQKLEKSKISLKPYLIIPRDDRWIIKYQEDFIHKHGSKIYSILQLSNQKDYLLEFKSLLAKCLQLKQAKITPERDETKLLQQKTQIYQKFIQWIQTHPLQQYQKYIERYYLQTNWITQNRGKPLDQVYPKKQQQIKTTNQHSSEANKININHQQSLNKRMQNLIKQARKSSEKGNEAKQRKQNQQKSDQNSKKELKSYGFKQQWECEYQKTFINQQKNDEVPSNIKAFLQNYEELPTFSSHSQQQVIENRKKQQAYTLQQQTSKIQEKSTFAFIKTFAVIFVIVLSIRLFF